MDEKFLFVRLAQLSPDARTAFAASCAEQLMPAYRAFCDERAWDPHRDLRRVLNRVWQHLGSGTPITKDEHTALDAAVLNVAPEIEGHPGSHWVDTARAACIAVDHALECAATGELGAAIEAANHAYENVLSELAHELDDEDAIEPGSPQGQQVCDAIARVFDLLSLYRNGPIDLDAMRALRFLPSHDRLYR